MALTLKLRELLEAEDNAATYRRLSIGGETTPSSTNHRTFERLCHNANAKEEAAGKATEEHHIQWDDMYNIFQEIGLDEHLELADMQLLHDHVGGVFVAVGGSYSLVGEKALFPVLAACGVFRGCLFEDGRAVVCFAGSSLLLEDSANYSLWGRTACMGSTSG